MDLLGGSLYTLYPNPYTLLLRACSSARTEQRPPEPCVARSNRARRAKKGLTTRVSDLLKRHGERSSTGRALDCGSRG